MPHFLLFPDYELFLKYNQSTETVEELTETYKDGLQFEVEPYYRNDGNGWRFDEEYIKKVETEFDKLVDTYNLLPQRDTLFLLALISYNKIIALNDTIEQTYLHTKRSKELAQLIRALKGSKVSTHNSVSIKTLTESVILTDQKLVTWINSLIMDAIKENQMPFDIMGFQGKSLQSDEVLQSIAKQRLPKFKFQPMLVEFCSSLYPFLVQETDIKPDENTMFSDNMLNFYFELLVMLDMIDKEKIGSDHKDYMRSVLVNYMKKPSS
ncbi:MAG: hypothetical protein B7X86_14365 [Sphingobacteriales bacterium 17-39-43]|uniref:hypothetical protein n=1 Tax=Daejeonella sp. TaxID=2805397 RepID=UPI000BDC2F4D|nr:hypothetical protein [Daejeonella sp.]OYZ30132.1 MAG: hypothetical protein B7Y24_14130 [Sphingobacteriales bacterium 16-39-50]OZA22850.1 MAG: hypothetical protein B7X86_14365 [Sphingobacteriales bacterium 17-39-43]HQT23998.1 hypothetical protein [Daejeonella sp.]HQT58662.1 hypothetical protein [Daejeonella sp.]